MTDFRDLNTGGAKLRTCRRVGEAGFEQWYEEYAKKAELLTIALARYNNGRMKRFLCELFLQQNLPILQTIMDRAAALQGTPKELAPAFRAIVAEALDSQQT